MRACVCWQAYLHEESTSRKPKIEFLWFVVDAFFMNQTWEELSEIVEHRKQQHFYMLPLVVMDYSVLITVYLKRCMTRLGCL